MDAARSKGSLRLRVAVEGVVKGKKGKELGAGEVDLSKATSALPDADDDEEIELKAVSYTHLTLPTICSV